MNKHGTQEYRNAEHRVCEHRAQNAKQRLWRDIESGCKPYNTKYPGPKARILYFVGYAICRGI